MTIEVTQIASFADTVWTRRRRVLGLRIAEKTIKSLKASASGNRIYYDGQVGGFGVRVTAGGAISFILTYWTAVSGATQSGVIPK